MKAKIDKKTVYCLLGMILVSGLASGAAEVKEGIVVNDVFDAQDTFESSETVYIKYQNSILCGKGVLPLIKDKQVDIYILKDATFSDGAKIDDSKIIKSIPATMAEICGRKKIWEPTLPAGKYDVFVDVSNCEIIKEQLPHYKCEKLRLEKHYNPALGDAYDSMNNIGFEVLPEMVTSVLLVAGLASMIVYTSMSRN